MEYLTGLLGFLGAIIAFSLTPIYGLVTFCGFLFLYPQRMVTKIGVADFTTGRIVVLGLLANAIFRAKLLQKLKFNLIDLFFVLVFICISLSALRTMPAAAVIVRQGGLLFDTLMPYLAVRLILTSKEDLLKFIKGVAIIGVPLSLMGLYECTTGKSPIRFLTPYYGMGFSTRVLSVAERMVGSNGKRMGIFRASGTFGIHISFGLFFAAIGPMFMGFWKYPKEKKVTVAVISGLLLVGLFTSASSSPLFSIVVSLAMIVLYPFRRFWPVLAVFVFMSLLFVELYSNRHFYHVITRLALNEETAYYRIGLFDQTFKGGMTGHWLFGYGYVGLGPGTDNSNFPFYYKDLVNIYLYYLVRYGLFGALPYICLNVTYYRKIYLGGLRAKSPADKWLVWCFASAMVGWNVAMMTVGALSQTEILMAMLLGISANLERIMASEAHGVVTILHRVAEPTYERFQDMPRVPWRSRFQSRVREEKVWRRHA